MWLEALSRETSLQASSFERPVATAAVRRDPVEPTTGYLTMVQSVNDRTTLRVLLDNLAEALRPLGVRTLIGPAQLLPHLGGGALGSHWHKPPPPDTPYNPPYLPEHLDALMSPLDEAVMFSFEPATEVRGADAQLEPFSPERLTRLLPLLQTATAFSPALSPPDAAEAELIVRWLEPYRPTGLLALVGGEPVGFVLVYPPTTPRRLVQRAHSSGARLWGGVLPDFQRQGVGRALLGAGLKVARNNLWARVSVGPVSQQGDAAAFLRAHSGAEAQRYTLYRADF